MRSLCSTLPTCCLLGWQPFEAHGTCQRGAESQGQALMPLFRPHRVLVEVDAKAQGADFIKPLRSKLYVAQEVHGCLGIKALGPRRAPASHASCWAKAFNKGFSVTKEPSKELRALGQRSARALERRLYGFTRPSGMASDLACSDHGRPWYTLCTKRSGLACKATWSKMIQKAGEERVRWPLPSTQSASKLRAPRP